LVVTVPSLDLRALGQFPRTGLAKVLIERVTGNDIAAVLPIRRTAALGSIPCIVTKPESGRTMLVKTYHDFFYLYPKWLIQKIPRISRSVPLPRFSDELLGHKGILLLRNPWESLTLYKQCITLIQRGCNTCPNRGRKLDNHGTYHEKGVFIHLSSLKLCSTYVFKY